MTVAMGLVAQFGLKPSFPFAQTNLYPSNSFGYAKRCEAVEDGGSDPDLRKTADQSRGQTGAEPEVSDSAIIARQSFACKPLPGIGRTEILPFGVKLPRCREACNPEAMGHQGPACADGYR